MCLMRSAQASARVQPLSSSALSSVASHRPTRVLRGLAGEAPDSGSTTMKRPAPNLKPRLAAFADEESEEVEAGLQNGEGRAPKRMQHEPQTGGEQQGAGSDSKEQKAGTGSKAAGEGTAAGAAGTSDAAEVHKARGLAHAEAGQHSQALVCWDKALALQPPPATAGSILELRAQVLLELGRDFEAIGAATRATSMCPDYAPAFLTLARAQLNYGEPKLALASYEAVLKLQPDHAEALEEIKDAQMKAIMHARMPGGRRAQVRVAGVPG